MRTGRLLPLFLGWVASSLAATQPDLSELGTPWPAHQVKVVCIATNKLPTTLHVFKVNRTLFSPAVLSNFISLAEFKKPSDARVALEPCLKGEDAHYEEAESRKWVGVSPRRGRFAYMNRYASSLPRQPIHGVPTESQARSLAFELLSKFNIPESEIAREPTGEVRVLYSSGQLGGYDRETGKEVGTTVTRGVRLPRAVEGIPIAGIGRCGGFYVDFGNNAAITELEIVWRTFNSERDVTIADTKQIISWLESGLAVLEADDEFDATRIKKLTVKQITPCYLGMDGSEMQRMLYPFAALTATADLGHTNAEVILDCPIFK